MALLGPGARLSLAYAALALLTLAAAAPGDLLAQEPEGELEQEVKAAYLLNFTRYVDWPAQALEGPDAPITLCVVGGPSFVDVVRRTVADRRSRGRAVRVVVPDTPAQADGCQVAYLAGEGALLDSWVRALRGRPTLTVGDGPEFIGRGGMIAFVIVNDAVRFEIDQDAAHRAGLQISSRVLALATRLYGGRAP